MKKVASNREALELLEQWGVDIALEESPQSRFSKPPRRSPDQSSDSLPPPVFHRSPSGPNPEIVSLRAQLKAIATLSDLLVFQSGFQGCALKRTATNMVFGEGADKPLVMLVGEAPGADEDLQGRPFVGKSGMLLDNILMSVGLSRKDNVYISNIIPWRPPGNRQPTLEETAVCLPFIERHIELVNPRVLLLVGAVSTKALMGTDVGITKFRGQWVSYTSAYEGKTFRAMPIFHPAYLLRSPGQKQKVWQDMLKLKLDVLSDNQTIDSQ